MFNKYFIILMLCIYVGQTLCAESVNELNLWSDQDANATKLFHIKGSILPLDPAMHVGASWPADITLSMNGGEFKGFVRSNGHFTISCIPSGSYVLYTYHPDIYFQPIRVEISFSGKIRARQLSHIKPGQVIKLPYPLRLKPLVPIKYFTDREEWNIMDYVLNPMFLLMVVPLILMLMLPALINDPETKREIENIQFPKIPDGVPDLNDMLTSFLAGRRCGAKDKKAAAAAAATATNNNKKRNKQ